MNQIKAISLNLLIPLFIAALFATILYNAQKLPEIIFDIVVYLFYGLSLLVIWVSWHFNRNRFIFVIIPLILIYLGFEYFDATKATHLFLYVSMLYPLHLMVFLVFKERGLFSLWGILKIVFVVLEIALVLYLLYYPKESIDAYLGVKLFAANFYPLKDLSVAIGIFVLFVMLALVLFGRYLMYATSFFILLLTYYGGLYFLKTPNAIEVAFLAFATIIFVLLIRESYRLAFYDELTSLPGRRAMIEDMAKLGRKYSLAMCDIDFFKKFNDTYGHDTGDEVLKMVASKFSGVSGGGKAYRYGGEEFVILFPSKDTSESFTHVDALRQVISVTPFTVRNKNSTKKIFINISAGVTQNSQKDKDPFAVMKRADNALYKAKKAGRNQVIKG